MLSTDKKLERQFATRIKLMADKIAFFYMNSEQADENTTKALKDMIKACQSELHKVDLNNNNSASLLQSRKEDIITRILSD